MEEVGELGFKVEVSGLACRIQSLGCTVSGLRLGCWGRDVEG